MYLLRALDVFTFLARALLERLRTGIRSQDGRNEEYSDELLGHLSFINIGLPSNSMAALLWTYARLPLYLGSGVVGLAGSALYYFQKYDHSA